MKRILFSYLITSAVLLAAAPVIFAATPTPSASPKASATPKATASPKTSASPEASPAASPESASTPSPESQAATAEKLKQLIKQGTERVKGVMDQNGDQQRGFIGEIQRVTDKTVSLKTFKGNEILTVGNDVIVTRDDKKATIDDFAIGDWAIAMGTMNKDVFTLKKLDVSSTTLAPRNFVTVIGTAKSVNRTSILVTLKNSEEPATYTTNSKTLYQDGQGNKVDVKTIKPEFSYLFIGYKDDAGATILTTVRTLGS